MIRQFENPDSRTWAERVKRGDRRAVARLITWLEDDREGASDILAQLHASTGKAQRIGFTGPPGSGKSSLVDRLITEYRSAGRRVAVVAVDPSSPFSGGAILGDRIRMQGHAGDMDVFIRSMSARGSLGGLAIATQAACHVLDAARYDVILIETVGVGQSELDIVRAADTVVLVQAPNLGDSIQAIKAGIMEVPDVIVVNKGDLPGSDRTLADIREMLHDDRPGGWTVPVCKVSVHDETGMRELHGLLDAHFVHLEASRERLERRRRQVEHEVLARSVNLLERRIRAWLSGDEGQPIVEAILDGQLDTISVATMVSDRFRTS